ncbi:chromosome segregation SMC family protein [uncultured Enterovirga sp.]|uniref:chromosome segregation SMC family protein n=1 Tax=uncultured Enterovirga sp. TaxID=2026352 RepID=UPI0035CBA7B4
MRLTKLRIVGFKTFVEPTDVPIEPGLTGIVGPNGCGKSNLVEALRWVMGESSHKNMRASGMDEVIFGGSATRPSRNTADVTLAIDNSDRSAPAAFNDADLLEVSRRIERAQGSNYHVNGREARARDVQLLFADAATGARSPAMVRQGQISELIAAKPQARRRILEDAAGIAGLHARRHEAELRLRQAEENLVRVEDVLRELGSQADSLRRQGRQASRYRGLSAEIRTLEARLAAAAWLQAERERVAAEEAARADMRVVADRTLAQVEAAKAQAVAAHELGPLREAEAATAAALRRLAQARTDLEGEERRAADRLAELGRRIAELERDTGRQAQLSRDAKDTIARLLAEWDGLEGGEEAGLARRAELETALAGADAALSSSEAELAAAQRDVADLTARRASLRRERDGEAERAARAAKEVARVRAERVAIEASLAGTGSAPLRTALAAATEAVRDAEAQAAAARQALGGAREAERRERGVVADAEKAAQRPETELATLRRLFSSESGKRPATILETLSVEPGYERALAAALGEDLEASTDPAASLRWQDTGSGEGDPPLPAGTTPLSAVVDGPPALRRRLRQISLVTRADAPRLANQLSVGQRLVSVEGDLWRWDGLAATADSPSPAARRLAEKNRIAGLAREADSARAVAEERRTVAIAAETRSRDAARAESAAVEAATRSRRTLDVARDELARAERREAEARARLSALVEAAFRVEAGESEALSRAAEAERLLAELPDGAAGERRHAEARARAAEDRARAAETRSLLAALLRESEIAVQRRTALAADLRLWQERTARSEAASAELRQRLAEATSERTELESAPDAFIQRRRGLASEISAADSHRTEAADRLRGAERAVVETDRAARAALEDLARSRETRAASEARSEALSRRVADLARSITDTFDTSPADLVAQSGLKRDQPFDPVTVETRLAGLKGDRERLGGVNLRAEEELAEAEGKRDRLAAERDDLVEAIKRLRQAVSALNREGRERLRAAFGIVDGHFRRLFSTLFGGGEAELALVDSDDPLEAGLEIMARPPGKRPQSLSLLSGGEQALTATALIFAVFLTNPSPICVLDEVDAPLDDANVERFCDLLRAMIADTDTRFLVITHNPITMARMDRLFGVTMAERGISQLVSVDLQAAERLREAG